MSTPKIILVLLVLAAVAFAGVRLQGGTYTGQSDNTGQSFPFTASPSGGEITWFGLEYSWDPDKKGYVNGNTCVSFDADGDWSWDNTAGSGNLDTGTSDARPGGV